MKALVVLLALLAGCATDNSQQAQADARESAAGWAAFLGGINAGKNRSRSKTCLATPIGRAGVYNVDCD